LSQLIEFLYVLLCERKVEAGLAQVKLKICHLKWKMTDNERITKIK
jgi:hypothetical protein